MPILTFHIKFNKKNERQYLMFVILLLLVIVQNYKQKRRIVKVINFEWLKWLREIVVN